MSQAVAKYSFDEIMDDVFAPNQVRTREQWRDKIFKLQDCLVNQFSEHLELEPTHRFCNGVYARELFMPQGTLIIGKIHRHEHLNIISHGSVSVITEDGLEHFCAPHTFISKCGTKRVVYAHTDAIWTTIHPTQETDLEKIEEQIICKDYDDLELLGAPL